MSRYYNFCYCADAGFIIVLKQFFLHEFALRKVESRADAFRIGVQDFAFYFVLVYLCTEYTLSIFGIKLSSQASAISSAFSYLIFHKRVVHLLYCSVLIFVAYAWFNTICLTSTTIQHIDFFLTETA